MKEISVTRCYVLAPALHSKERQMQYFENENAIDS